MRDRISRTAASVNVMAMSWLSRVGFTRLLPLGVRCEMNRSVSTNVFPQPAPAESATDASRHSMAAHCSGVRSVEDILMGGR